MTDRTETFRKILQDEACFKMICGAGNEDGPYVKKLALVYTLAGAKVLDVSANPDIVRFAREGVEEALQIAPSMNIDVGIRPYIMVSVGMPGDHHVRKSYIDPFKCVGCKLCIPVCPTNAIPKLFTDHLERYKSLGGSYENEDQAKEIVIKDLCIGCGKCSNICPRNDIISYRHNERALREILPACMEAGAEMFELHAATDEHEVTMKEWELINEINASGFNSMCLDRLNLGNLQLEFRIAEAKSVAGNRFIVQADGYPMSGGLDDFNTTLQAVACADVVNKKFNMYHSKTRGRAYRPHGHRLGVYIILSGGTNSLSKKLADQAGVRINGVAVGTFARSIIDRFVTRDDFYESEQVILEACISARQLITANGC